MASATPPQPPAAGGHVPATPASVAASTPGSVTAPAVPARGVPGGPSPAPVPSFGVSDASGAPQVPPAGGRVAAASGTGLAAHTPASREQAVCAFAVIGKGNNPLYTRAYGNDDHLKFQFILHTALDIVDERISDTKGAGGADKDLNLGLLTPVEDYKVCVSLQAPRAAGTQSVRWILQLRVRWCGCCCWCCCLGLGDRLPPRLAVSAHASAVPAITTCWCRFGYVTNTHTKLIVVTRDISIRDEDVRNVSRRDGCSSVSGSRLCECSADHHSCSCPDAVLSMPAAVQGAARGVRRPHQQPFCGVGRDYYVEAVRARFVVLVPPPQPHPRGRQVTQLPYSNSCSAPRDNTWHRSTEAYSRAAGARV